MICKNCRELDTDHVDGKCMWQPTQLEPALCQFCNRQYLILGDYEQYEDGKYIVVCRSCVDNAMGTSLGNYPWGTQQHVMLYGKPLRRIER